MIQQMGRGWGVLPLRLSWEPVASQKRVCAPGREEVSGRTGEVHRRWWGSENRAGKLLQHWAVIEALG